MYCLSFFFFVLILFENKGQTPQVVGLTKLTYCRLYDYKYVYPDYCCKALWLYTGLLNSWKKSYNTIGPISLGILPRACVSFIDELGERYSATCNPLLSCRARGVLDSNKYKAFQVPQLSGRYRGYRQSYLAPIISSNRQPRTYCLLNALCEYFV